MLLAHGLLRGPHLFLISRVLLFRRSSYNGRSRGMLHPLFLHVSLVAASRVVRAPPVFAAAFGAKVTAPEISGVDSTRSSIRCHRTSLTGPTGWRHRLAHPLILGDFRSSWWFFGCLDFFPCLRSTTFLHPIRWLSHHPNVARVGDHTGVLFAHPHLT